MENSNTIITIIAIVGTITSIYSLAIYFLRNSRIQREELKKSQAELSLMRERLESQLYAINQKMNSDEIRWRDVNHLLVNTINQRFQETALKTPKNDSFFENLGIDLKKTKVTKDQIFLLTPFHNEFDKMYNVVKELCTDIGFKVIRGDEEFIKGNILKYIVKNILESRVVIANLSGRNPNVYYELGIAHSMGKPVILLTEELNEVPFDLRNNRLIIYGKDKSLLKLELRKSLSTFLINEKSST